MKFQHSSSRKSTSGKKNHPHERKSGNAGGLPIGKASPARRPAGLALLASALPVAIAALFLAASANRAGANPPIEKDPSPRAPRPTLEERRKESRRNQLLHKEIDQPNIDDFARAEARRRLIEEKDRLARTGKKSDPTLDRQLQTLTKTGTDRVLVILVEFAGTDPFTFTPGESTWDPIGKCDASEYTGNTADLGTPAAANNIISFYNITGPTVYNYTGPLHNQIPRPLSATDASKDMIWTPDFTPSFYSDLIFGNGVHLQYTRADDSSVVDQDFTGMSVNHYYEDLSDGQYSIAGEVVGWLQLSHSVWWYGADEAPGARSGVSVGNSGGIPGAGNSKSLVRDALDAVNAAYPDFDWSVYDTDGDGVVNRLWIIHAGMGEEDSPTVLNRTTYGEGGMWSHSSSLSPYYTVSDEPGQDPISVGPYIMMPENCGIGVLAHEFGHNLGTMDLYAYGEGETSAGFWTLMADDWTGYPIGFQPPALDPMHLDYLGWLEPYVVTDPNKVHTVTVGQASAFPGGDGVYRGVRIPLPDQLSDPLPVQPAGNYYWWGGQDSLANGGMQLAAGVDVPDANTNLVFRAAWDIEYGWDFLWIQASEAGTNDWKTLTNPYTSTGHDSGWIGGQYGFPDDLAAAGIGGLSGTNPGYPDYTTQTFSLAAFAGKKVLVRFWYMTDWNTVGEGPYIDNLAIRSGASTLLSDNAETDSGSWLYAAPWARNDGHLTIAHDFYLQWRNVSATGGYDSALGNPNWRFGPANTGLLVWYNNTKYYDNEIFDYLFDDPGFGPKGRMLVVDAHPEPYRDPYWVANGYPNEAADLNHRSLMRDAPFSLEKCVDFTMPAGYVHDSSTTFTGYAAAPQFSDALGYYPGAENVPFAPAYPGETGWITKQWDASTVVPSTAAYGIKAPGYADEEFNFGVVRYGADDFNGYWLGSGEGLGYNGGTGNPQEVDGQYGWNVKVISQTDQTATLQIWNSRYVQPSEDRPDLWCIY